MFFLSLAILAQTAVTTPAAQDAMRCATAAAVAAPEGEAQLRTTSHFMYFAMQATQAEPGDGPFLNRLGEIAQSASSQTPPSAEEAATMLADCDKRFPLAKATTVPRLPADQFDRDVMCLGVLSLMQGAAEAMKEDGDAAPVDEIRAALQPVAARLTDDVLAKRGVAEESRFVTVMGDQVRATLKIGNPASIARACGVTL